MAAVVMHFELTPEALIQNASLLTGGWYRDGVTFPQTGCLTLGMVHNQRGIQRISNYLLRSLGVDLFVPEFLIPL
jgi:hypothetical protein